jgi:GT2 family glycosyltransferase
MAKKDPLVVMIPVNYNGVTTRFRSKPVLFHCLGSLQRTNYDNFRIVVTDDSSPDESVAYIKKTFPKIETVVSRPNGGFVKAANFAMRYAIKKYNPDYILLSCNGIVAKDRSWLKKMLAVAESDSKIGIVGCKMLYPNGELQDAGFPTIGPSSMRNRARELSAAEQSKKGLYNGVEEVEALSVMHLVKRKVLDKVGLHDEKYYMGSDDIDYCLAVRRAGFRVMYDGGVSLIHIEGASFDNAAKQVKNKDRWFPVLQINRVYFAFKNFGTAGRISAMLNILMGSLVGIGARRMTLLNLKLKDRIPWRLKTSLRAIVIGYRLYKNKITVEEAFGLKR